MASDGFTAERTGLEGPGWDALRQGDWSSAKAAFADELTRGETPQAFEGLGRATRWLDEVPESFEAQERAYLLYKEQDAPCSAARVAINLARDAVLARNDLAIAQGWFARAERLLDGQPECGIHAWLAFRRGQTSFYNQNDFDLAAGELANAVAIAERNETLDVEMGARSQLGLLSVMMGDVDGGMRALDEAATAAISGEVSLLDVAGGICCDMIFACEQVRDVDRATQWCKAATEIAERGQLTPLLGACRAHYSTILIWQGQWDRAERELLDARELLERHALGISREGLERLASLRILQGRLDEAEELCEQIDWSPNGKLCKARIAFERGDLPLAKSSLGALMRALAPRDRMTRVDALDLAVDVAVATEDLESATEAATQLRTIAVEINTDAILATAHFAQAKLFVAMGEDETALEQLEQAIDIWSRLGAVFETAKARDELSRLLMRTGRGELAAAEAERAANAYRQLGVERPASEPVPPDPQSVATTTDSLLTAREVEVLKLVAEGHSNERIAEELFVSPHTVHRHMANIRNKLDQPSRAAAVAFAAREGLI